MSGTPIVARRVAFVIPLVLLVQARGGEPAKSGYLGRDVCAGCHQDIASTQIRTNMARTWQGAMSPRLPAKYAETLTEGPEPPIRYTLENTGARLQYRVQLPGQPAQEFPIETIVGGDRHGISFLLRIPELDGLPLPVARLIEARYFHSSAQNHLAFSLGFPEDKPKNYETAFGRVLTPYLEKRCLSCHVEPRAHGTRVETGVSCENCHGAGQSHLAAIGKIASRRPAATQAATKAASQNDLGILNPARLPVAERMRPCTQCHAGSSLLEDPLPEDVLISDQVTALKNSECWRQTGGEITCTNCHNPHQDAPRAVLVARAERTCASCHSLSVAKHAGICPVNRTKGCVTCHMADEVRGAFTIAEHWIRVPVDFKQSIPPRNPAWRTTVSPKHLFLREIVSETSDEALALRKQIQSGESFFDVARSKSSDRVTGDGGGYLGDLQAAELDPAWAPAALRLEPGELSGVVPANGKYVILQRMPRNFREDAAAVFNKAMDLRKQGKGQESMAQLVASLKIYPRFLRALTYLGVAYGEGGNPQTGARILEVTTGFFPKDAGAHFNLAIAYGATGNDNEIAEYRKTLEIDPDYVPAYLNLGGALYGKGQYEEAIKAYRDGINVNPLVASLHYSLSVVLEHEQKSDEAAREMALALKIDPNAGSGNSSR